MQKQKMYHKKNLLVINKKVSYRYHICKKNKKKIIRFIIQL